MERMDHTKYSGLEYAYHGGTFAGNALTLAAGLATINVLEHSPVYAHIDKLGDIARETLNKIFHGNGFPALATGIGSLFAIHMSRGDSIPDAKHFAVNDDKLSRRLFSYLLENGVLMVVPENLHGAISYVHSESDIRRLMSLIEGFVKEN